MAKRRTKKQKVRTRLHPVAIVKSIKKAGTEKELYFKQDFLKSLAIISIILTVEFTWWYLHR